MARAQSRPADLPPVRIPTAENVTNPATDEQRTGQIHLATVVAPLPDVAGAVSSPPVADLGPSLPIEPTLTELPSDEQVPALQVKRSLLFRIWDAAAATVAWCFGFVCLLIGLAVLASIPILQFISLGYLLEASGRTSRSGRIRDGFFGIENACRIGSVLAGTWLMLLPLRLVADLWYSARLIDPSSGVTASWFIGLMLLTVLMICHILLAWFSGGQLRHFFWPILAPFFFALWLLQKLVSHAVAGRLVGPIFERWTPRLYRDLTTVPPLTAWFPPSIVRAAIRRGQLYVEARDSFWNFLVSLEVSKYFWLGLQGFLGALAWLAIPILMIIATTKMNGGNPQESEGLGVLLGLFGSFLLAIVVLYLPFLQAHFAAERRFQALFELRTVRHQFRRAPIAFWMALLITLVFAIPLYLLKVAVIPREVVWLPSLVFVSFILPARLATGWALGRARRRELPRHFVFRWFSRFSALPVVGLYVLIVYFTQYTSWYGSWSLFEQHAFLTPVPFLGL